MFRFWIALWASKLCLFIYKHTGHTRDDRPGMLAFRFCPDFLKYVAKPETVVCVMGTNGKSTVSGIVNNFFVKEGKKTAYNDWGANHLGGQARCLLDAVNIFNRPNKDAAVIETDELTSPQTVPYIKPNYIIVTNLFRDSIRRNAHPEYIFSKMDKALSASPSSVLILNANDPVSCFLANENKRVYYGAEDMKTDCFKNNIDDFSVCPVCHSIPKYNYKHYAHLGDFYCEKCGLKTPDSDYLATHIDLNKQEVEIKENGDTFKYPLVSDTLFNAFNVISIISLFRTMGMTKERIAEILSESKIPATRESSIVVNGIKIYSFVAKGQNVSAASTVFEYLAKEPSKKEIILMLDEYEGDTAATETITWIYESDFEFLNQDNIKKIIVTGERIYDYKLRLLIAGIDESKIICVRNEYETPNYVDTKGIEKIYVLHDVGFVTKGKKIRDAIGERIEKEAGALNEN